MRALHAPSPSPWNNADHFSAPSLLEQDRAAALVMSPVPSLLFAKDGTQSWRGNAFGALHP